MTEQLYRLCWRYEGEEEIRRDEPVDKDNAEAAAWMGNMIWGDMIRHWIEPVPPYTPPAITAEHDLETAAGSPGCVDGDDLLGVKPPCQ